MLSILRRVQTAGAGAEGNGHALGVFRRRDGFKRLQRIEHDAGANYDLVCGAHKSGWPRKASPSVFTEGDKKHDNGQPFHDPFTEPNIKKAKGLNAKRSYGVPAATTRKPILGNAMLVNIHLRPAERSVDASLLNDPPRYTGSSGAERKLRIHALPSAGALS